jgi:hypothetical protein
MASREMKWGAMERAPTVHVVLLDWRRAKGADWQY